MPIVIYYGDYISAGNPHWASQRWIERIHMAQAFADCVNRHGGDASVVRCPTSAYAATAISPLPKQIT
jgi:hypothetical protein